MTRVPEYHNMSVPPFSSVTVGRATLAGPRFKIDFEAALTALEWPAPAVRSAWPRLRRSGWRAAARLLAVPRGRKRRRRGQAVELREAVSRTLKAALSKAGVPDRIGLLCPEADPAGKALGAAACLAVLARRSGPLYLPARAFEPSLVMVSRLTLVFPEEVELADLA